MKKRYYSKVSPWISITLWGSVILCCVICFPLFFSNDSLIVRAFALVILTITISLLLSIFFNTYYTIENGLLHYVTGPFKGKIEIASIREITYPKSLMEISGMMKPVLSSKPLLIKYNKYDDMPFSPSEEEAFIVELRKVNSEIRVSPT